MDLLILIMFRNISIIVFLGCLMNFLVRVYLNKRMDKMEKVIPFEIKINLKREFINDSIESEKEAFQNYTRNLKKEYEKYRKVRVG